MADVMLETESGIVRNVEIDSLQKYIRERVKGFIESRLPALITLHLGAEFVVDQGMKKQLGHDLCERKPAYRVFCLDLDCNEAGEEFFPSHAFMAALYAVSTLQQFGTPPVNDDDAMVCFTGGFHVYFASSRLAALDTDQRSSLLRGIEREPLFVMTDSGNFRRKAVGPPHMWFGRFVEWRMGSLFRMDKEGCYRLVWDCARESHFLVAHTEAFLRASVMREREWLVPFGPVSSALASTREVARAECVRGRLDTLQNDLDAGRVGCMASLLSSLGRLTDYAKSKGEDPLEFASGSWLSAVVMYACISYDCAVSGLSLDHHTRSMTHMLRAPLSAKIKRWKDGPTSGTVTSYISLPLGNPAQAVEATWDQAALQATDMRDSVQPRDNPALEGGLGRFYAWSRRVRFEQNRAWRKDRAGNAVDISEGVY
eukprot:768373-Hanusia_phi.AAC.2